MYKINYLMRRKINFQQLKELN